MTTDRRPVLAERLAQTPERAANSNAELRTLLRQAILRNASEAQIEMFLRVCQRYGFDPLLNHVALINGRIYVMRDGLLHIAHRSGMLDGIEVEAVRDEDGQWVATARVYRRDMSHPFTYSALQREHENPASPAWQKAPRAMTIKAAEVMALRRAFHISLPAAIEVGQEDEA